MCECLHALYISRRIERDRERDSERGGERERTNREVHREAAGATAADCSWLWDSDNLSHLSGGSAHNLCISFCVRLGWGAPCHAA